jgi:hypothetical protein
MVDCFAMIRRGLVKAIVALSALGGCATPRPGGSTGTPAVTVAARESDAPPPAPPPDETPTLTGLSAEELAAVRPLLVRGPASVVRNPDGGRDARITLLTRTDATPEIVRRVITTPGDYATFMPILRGVDVLSQHGNRTGFRFHVAAPLFDVTALCAMRAASARRVDVDILESEIGPGASRWDLLPDGDGTVVSLSTWGDPSQGHWLLRMVARRSPSAIAGMNISVDTVLALGAVRRAEILSGRSLPVRPAEGAVAAGELAPPEDGPWIALARDAMVVSTRMTPEGSVQQVTVATWAAASPQAVLTRLADVPSYPAVWGSVREVEVLPSAPGAPADSVRFRSVVETPLVRLEGEQRMEREGMVLRHIGLTGDFADAAHRWDVREAPGGGSYVMLTGGADTARAGGITRALMARDPWLMAGFAGSWKIVWLRNALRGM